MQPHSLFIITGANRGFGRAIVTAVADAAKHKTTVILVGRNANELENVVQSVKDNVNIDTLLVSDISLETASEAHDTIFVKIKHLIQTIQSGYPVLTRAVLVNNAGTTGDLSKKIGEYTAAEIQNYVNVNIASYVTLVSGFVNLLKEKPFDPDQPTPFPPALTIVNISSLLAVKAFPHWGLYATGKAARDMLLSVLAEEESSIRTLSYAPGPLDNEMQASVRATIGNEEQKQVYTDMANKGTLVKMKDSARKLIRLVDKADYRSGAHIDFYDKE
ncbi:sepiapterin reductase [Phycomyces blakesleeanus]